jgi:hypothetical protein
MKKDQLVTWATVSLTVLEPFRIYFRWATMRHEFASEDGMSVVQQTHARPRDGRAPIIVSVLAIAGLSALSWGLVIGIAIGVWSAV